MLRIIMRIVDVGSAANVGGPVDIWFRTFDVSLSEIETALKVVHKYESREIVGVEVISEQIKDFEKENGNEPSLTST